MVGDGGWEWRRRVLNTRRPATKLQPPTDGLRKSELRRLRSMVRRLGLLSVLCVIFALTGCGEASYGLPKLKLRYETTIERRASLSSLRRAWADRPAAVNDGARLYERALLNRAALFGRKVKGTETYDAACNFWMACVRDHIERYEDDAERFGR